jgi:hypothetical protein
MRDGSNKSSNEFRLRFDSCVRIRRIVWMLIALITLTFVTFAFHVYAFLPTFNLNVRQALVKSFAWKREAKVLSSKANSVNVSQGSLDEMIWKPQHISKNRGTQDIEGADQTLSTNIAEPPRDLRQCNNGLHRERKGFWRFFGSDFPNLYDAFARDQMLYVIFNIRNADGDERCSNCLVSGGLMLKDNGVYHLPQWVCDFGTIAGRVPAEVIVDPHRNAAVVTCTIPFTAAPAGDEWHAKLVNITAEVQGRVLRLYRDVEYCVYPVTAGGAQGEGGAEPARQRRLLVGCTMVLTTSESATVEGCKILEWLAYHRLQVPWRQGESQS